MTVLPASQGEKHSRRNARRTLPLYVQVLAGVAAGVVFGLVFGTRPFLFGFSNQDLHDLGMLVIRLLKTMAIPLVFFAIVDSLLQIRITAKDGARLIGICLINVSVAFAIGVTILNVFKPGNLWRGRLQEITGISRQTAASSQSKATLNPIRVVEDNIPRSLVEPFLENKVIQVVLVALFLGAALRQLRQQAAASGGNSGIENIARAINTFYRAFMIVLMWVVSAVPFAVFGVVAYVVGKAGLKELSLLRIFLGTILAGLAIHSLFYYPLIVWLAGKKSPRIFFGRGADAILTGLSTNSSLATVPVTLRCLTEGMGVSERSARLSACIGTNLNNDGITLYDAMAALFLAQAVGFDLTVGQQAMVVLASLMAGIGIAGIPEAGLIVLPLVLAAAGLPEEAVMAMIPFILTVDWIIARCRSAVNVMGDMVVAILLDRK